MVLVILALAVTVGIGILRGRRRPTEAVVIDGRTGDGAAARMLYVHVFGAVSEPGLYVLEEGARVVDAIAAAGGLLDGADEAAVNLARPVGDGEQLHVPLVGAEPAGEPGRVAAGVEPGTAAST